MFFGFKISLRSVLTVDHQVWFTRLPSSSVSPAARYDHDNIKYYIRVVAAVVVRRSEL